MKKVFMSFAVIAMMVAISACGNKGAKAETEVAVEATEIEAEADTTACTDSTACADSTVVEAATEAIAE